MAPLFLWFLLCLLSGDTNSQSSDTAILDEIKALTTEYSKQNTELVSRFDELKTELIKEVKEIIDEEKTKALSARHDLANLQKLLDTDECLEMTHKCSPDAICEDTRVSYKCHCKEGLTGDGFTCEDIDECAENATICGFGTKCKNTVGNYSCECDTGYEIGISGSCEDIDECSGDEHGCSSFGFCTNLPGGYNCTCSSFYEGDGKECTAMEVNCSSPFKAVEGVGCIHIIDDEQEFDQGRRSCKALGGDIFIADNKHHYVRLAEYFRNSGQASKGKYMWVGVKGGRWLSGRKVAPEEESPDNPTMSEDKCSYTDGDTKDKFLLWTDPCYYDWRVLCQQKSD